MLHRLHGFQPDNGSNVGLIEFSVNLLLDQQVRQCSPDRSGKLEIAINRHNPFASRFDLHALPRKRDQICILR
jgi:hypothetical protein